MKHKCLCKGIITLCLLLCFSITSPFFFTTPLTAYAAEAEIKLNVKTKTIVKGKEYALKVYNLTENQTVSFKSDDESVASVDANGLVTALAVGTARITVTVTNMETKELSNLQCDIIVGPPAISIQLSRSNYNLTIGQRVFIEKILQPLNTVEDAKFLSLDKNVATVSTGGFITAKNTGSTFIIAQIDNGAVAVCQVVVTAPAIVEESVIVDEFNDTATINEIAAASFEMQTRSVQPISEETTQSDFESFLKRLNADFANGDNASENTDTTITK